MHRFQISRTVLLPVSLWPSSQRKHQSLTSFVLCSSKQMFIDSGRKNSLPANGNEGSWTEEKQCHRFAQWYLLIFGLVHKQWERFCDTSWAARIYIRKHWRPTSCRLTALSLDFLIIALFVEWAVTIRTIAIEQTVVIIRQRMQNS